MAQKPTRFGLLLLASFLIPSTKAHATFAEVFAKVSASRTYTDANTYTINISGATGLAILIIPQLRIEGRYTTLRHTQNRLVSSDFTLRNIITQTNIYSVGLDLDILSEKYVIQPFIVVGAGVIQSSSHYNVEDTGEVIDVPREGLSANAGVGIRIRIGKSFAFEIEGYAYAMNPQKPNPLIDAYGNAGIRFFL